MQTIYPVFLQFMYNTHGIIYIQGTCNSFSSMPTFHCLYKLPFENFVIVMWRSCPVLIDVGWPGLIFCGTWCHFCLGQIVCATSCPSKPLCSTCRRRKTMAEPTFQHSALQEYVVDANDVMRFKLVSQEKDLDNESLEFAPEMCHQVTLEMRNCL